MKPPLVKTTRTAPVSACDGVARPNESNTSEAAPRNQPRHGTRHETRYFLIDAFSLLSVRGRTGLIEGDHHLGDIGRHFEAGLGALQRDRDALVVPELHAADAAEQRAARADHRIGA